MIESFFEFEFDPTEFFSVLIWPFLAGGGTTRFAHPRRALQLRMAQNQPSQRESSALFAALR
jgi:hypothetical protein